MTVKKLSDSDKSEILDLYRHTGETTSTLAERYGVSNSTISRFLKITLAEEEYEALIQQKRAARTSVADARQTLLFSEPEPNVSVVSSAQTSVLSKPEPSVSVAEPLVVQPSPDTDIPSFEQMQWHSSPTPQLETETPAKAKLPQPTLNNTLSDRVIPRSSPLNKDAGRIPFSPPQRLEPPAVVISNPNPLDEDSGAQATAVAQMLGEDLLDESELADDLDDEDLDDLDDLDEEDLDEETSIVTSRVRSEALVQVLPLSEATLPKTCYLVIDRASELITKPLKDFGDLGHIPTQEFQQKTLPVFDNHRVARRFSTKRDRVIKVPDSKVLQKTRSHLHAKGITLLLVDGQVYSLLNN